MSDYKYSPVQQPFESEFQRQLTDAATRKWRDGSTGFLLALMHGPEDVSTNENTLINRTNSIMIPFWNDFSCTTNSVYNVIFPDRSWHLVIKWSFSCIVIYIRLAWYCVNIASGSSGISIKYDELDYRFLFFSVDFFPTCNQIFRFIDSGKILEEKKCNYVLIASKVSPQVLQHNASCQATQAKINSTWRWPHFICILTTLRFPLSLHCVPSIPGKSGFQRFIDKEISILQKGI